MKMHISNSVAFIFKPGSHRYTILYSSNGKCTLFIIFLHLLDHVNFYLNFSLFKYIIIINSLYILWNNIFDISFIVVEVFSKFMHISWIPIILYIFQTSLNEMEIDPPSKESPSGKRNMDNVDEWIKKVCKRESCEL